MAKFILGKKMGMTQKFLEDGTVVATTVIKAGPCTIAQVKSDKDGYKAVQVGFDTKRVINKPLAGHLKGLANFRYLREFRVLDTANFEKGKVFDLSSFEVGDQIKVTAISKGKGFQGVVKRHGFHGSPASHGHKDQLRMPGSIGATDAARVFKGTRMAGHMGVDTVTVPNLKIVEIDQENNLLYVKGAIPGHRNTLVKIVADGDLTFVDLEAKKEVKSEATEETAVEAEVKEEVTSEAVENSEVATEEKEETKVEEKVEAPVDSTEEQKS
ncbi:50S ribosomal protein L3 [Candidatus Nomurabacteria bacterium]|nr:50S ribosomal protein L3 [Candidatus Nomurabacteria bacterium]